MKSPLERLTCEQIVIFPSTESNLATRLFNANVKQVINVTQLVVGKMVAEKQPGAVVNVSSQASQAALGDHTVYCATKGALDMVTKWVEKVKNWDSIEQILRVAALEFGPHQVRVNAVNPTVTMTEMGKVNYF